jgi:hypothetical protein
MVAFPGEPMVQPHHPFDPSSGSTKQKIVRAIECLEAVVDTALDDAHAVTALAEAIAVLRARLVAVDGPPRAVSERRRRPIHPSRS